MQKLVFFFKDESGIETFEYAVIGAIIITVAVLIYGAGWGADVKQQILNAASLTSAVTT